MGDFEDIILPGEGNDPVGGNTPGNGGNNSGNNGNNGNNNSEDDSIGGGPIEPELDGGYIGFSIDTPTEKA